MPVDSAFATIPVVGVFAITLILILMCVEAGYQYARHKHRAEVEKEAPVGAMVAAMLGLLAFILAFTFGMAADRFHERKVALLDEANAIRSTYLLCDLIPEPRRTEVRNVLRDYVKEQLQWVGVGKAQGVASAKALLDQLWLHAAAVGAQNPGSVDVFLDSVRQVIEIHQARIMVRERSHIPTAFWVALYAVAMLSLTAVGYHAGVAGTNRSPVSVAVAIAFSVVIMLISDLDRPGEGFINVSQQAMIDVRDFMTGAKQ